MMNPWVKRKWVRALRSGEYTQAAGWLILTENKEYSHCCLGVLACEMVPEYVRKVKDAGYEPGVDGHTDILPDDLVTLWGFGIDEQDVLSKMNDDGYNFTEIADWIEENL